MYIASTMRYEANLAPLLTILVGLVLGWASTKLANRPRPWRMVLFLVGISILISIVIGLLTNFQNGDWLFKNNNPQLYQAIERIFTIPK
jgi:F0F1-type ATP synthase assembly protein I